MWTGIKRLLRFTQSLSEFIERVVVCFEHED